MSETKSVYEIVTERILESIEKGVAPWRKTWASGFTFNGKRVSSPINAVTGKAYRGVNTLLLSLSDFTDPRYCTFNQAKSLGGNVKKGEKGTPVVFFKWVEIEEENEDKTKTKKRIPILRYYTVFNVSQCEGLTKLKELLKVKPAEAKKFNPIKNAEAVLSGMKNPVKVVTHGGDRAYYSPMKDTICMPSPDSFETSEAYYVTRFHEEAHATGHETRLNRPFTGTFGDDKYSREELVAELTAAFLAVHTGMDPDLDNSAAYLKGWLKPLKNDPKFIVFASGQAQKACDFILGIEPDNGEETE